jgi:hypothetical protein
MRKDVNQRTLLSRADCLLSRSGEWGQGLDENRIAEFAKSIVECECLRTILLKTDVPMMMARYLAGIELEEKFNREWLAVKKLLQKRKEKLRSRKSQSVKNPGIGSSLNLELLEINRRLDWMRLGPRTPAGASSPGSKPFLYDRWHVLHQMEEHIQASYKSAVLGGLSRKFDNLAYERKVFKVNIPEWADIKSLPNCRVKNALKTSPAF